MAALTKLVNVMAGGGVPKESAPFIFGGNLFLKLLQDIPDLTLNVWFLDDGELGGTKEALKTAWDTLVEHGVPRGMILSKEK